jgi:Ca-activated chloride channel family protein
VDRSVATAVLGFALLVTSVGAQTFRSGIDLTSLGVTVVDRKGVLVTDLAAVDFDILEDGKRQEVKLFIRGGDGFDDGHPASNPELHLGLLFDTSGSMEEDISLSRSAAVKFLNTLPGAEDITLVDFDTEVRVARYGQADFARLVERIRRRRPDGWTALYDALGVYLDGAAAQGGRKILVVYTDGGDNNSALMFGEALDLLKASDVTVYAVGFLTHQPPSVQLEQRIRIQQIVELTGGQAFFPSTLKDLEPAFDRVRAEILAQYTLGYLSSNTRPDGTWRKVEVKITRPGTKVRTRRGYYAPYRKTP